MFINLYKSIKDVGYKERPALKSHYIKGTVNSKGYLIINGGYHRLSILKHLKYKSIPILVTDHYPEFETFYNNIYGVQKKGEFIYHPVNHWSCSEWTASRGANRSILISQHIEDNSRILDLGCDGGGVSHDFAFKGCKIIGIDHRAEAIYNARYVATYHASRNREIKKYINQLNGLLKYDTYKIPTYIQSNIIDGMGKIKGNVDYTLFLSVYRWLLKNKTATEVITKMGKMTNKAIFMDVEHHLEKETKQQILKLTKFTKIDKIGIETSGDKMGRAYNKPRKIYKIS